MSKKAILLKEQIEQIKNSTNLDFNVEACAVNDAIIKITSSNPKSNIEIVFKELDYKKYGGEFIASLKNLKANYKTLIVDKICKNFYASKTLFSISEKVCIVVGDDEFIKATNVVCSLKGVKCYAFLTTPHFSGLLKNEYTYIERGKLKTKNVNFLNGLFICEDVIKKCGVYEVLKSYSLNLLTAITLIDYKFSSMLEGKIADEKYYKLLKQSFNLTLNFSSYENASKVLTVASLIVNVVDAKTQIIKNSTANNYINVTLLTQNGYSLPKIYFTGFEKLIKLYHFYFSNDFSSLLLFPDYVNDLEKVSLILSIKQDELYAKLKVPSSKRLELISKLLKTVGDGFLNETASLMKIFPNIERAFYTQLYKEEKPTHLNANDIKNTLRFSTYLIDGQNTLVVMRDLGLLN